MLLALINKESTANRNTIIFAASVSGVANAGLLAVANAAAEATNQGEDKLRLMFMFVIALFLFAFFLKYTYDRSSEVFEHIMSQIRLRISEKISNSDLTTVDGIGRALIYNRLTQETEVVSQSQQTLVGALQSAVMVFFISLYIAWISLPAFLLTLLLTLAAVAVFLYKDKESQGLLQEASAAQVRLLKAVTDLLDGFKQAKIRHSLGKSLLREIEDISDEVYKLRIASTSLFNNNNIFAMSFFYVLIGAIVFILPRFIPTYSDIIHQLSSAILFIIGPLGVVVGGIPTFAKANMAVRSIYELEALLDDHGQEQAEEDQANLKHFYNFKRIDFHNVEFAYRNKRGEPTFRFGPVSMSLIRGEVLFIVGGNGSGKSTFLKLMTGLYKPLSGSITVDGEPINYSNRQSYRELFSVIFGDFHLFEKLHGIDADQQAVVSGIERMKMIGKTDFDGERFSNLDLSTGQRKRIALIISILENRPIIILDEWAADQDPEFRERFYLELIPELAATGKTVIAVTHDDHYFDSAERVLKLDLGKIDYYQKPETDTSQTTQNEEGAS